MEEAMGVLLGLLVMFAGLASAQLSPQRAEAKGEPMRAGWCQSLPRTGYGKLERITVSSNWFEVYRIRPGVFAIYEPHQYEEVISYLIVGNRRALLFDTGMGIGDISRLAAQLTSLPVSVLNSHTHNDHVGDNWRFKSVYGMDTAFTRENARGSK